jgi:hypothetical protein
VSPRIGTVSPAWLWITTILIHLLLNGRGVFARVVSAPELNPVEGVWDHLKYVELRNFCCWDLPHLNTELTLAIRRLRTKPHLIRACFAGAGLSLQ